MRLRSRIALAVAAAVAIPGLWLVATVSAHATIGSAAWNDPNNPTKVIATSRGDDIRNEAGTYSLRVFDPSGREITAGNAVITGPKTMEVAVSRPTTQGQYRVEWKTRSAEPDAHDAMGNVSLQLNSVSAPAATTPPSTSPTTTSPSRPVAPPSTGDAGLLDSGSSGFAAAAFAVASLLVAATVVSKRRAA
jgi:methionine-rich copper-binding protein CopC